MACRECFQQVCQCPGSINTEAFIDPTPAILRHASEIRMRILRRLLDNAEWERLVALSIERSGPDSIGAKEYGNASHRKDSDELHFEGACEIADLIFYDHIIVARDAG